MQIKQFLKAMVPESYHASNFNFHFLTANAADIYLVSRWASIIDVASIFVSVLCLRHHSELARPCLVIFYPNESKQGPVVYNLIVFIKNIPGSHKIDTLLPMGPLHA